MNPADAQVEQDVRTALAADPRVPARDVAVSSRAGTVTLRGTVANLKERHAAIAVARAVPGVNSVYDLIRARLLSADPRDDELRGAALQSLMSDSRVPGHDVDVTVTAAWATLKGRVRYQHQSDAAFEDVAAIDGMGGISNEINVVTRP